MEWGDGVHARARSNACSALFPLHPLHHLHHLHRLHPLHPLHRLHLLVPCSLNKNPAWQGVAIILSDATVPGACASLSLTKG